MATALLLPSSSSVVSQGLGTPGFLACQHILAKVFTNLLPTIVSVIKEAITQPSGALRLLAEGYSGCLGFSGGNIFYAEVSKTLNSKEVGSLSQCRRLYMVFPNTGRPCLTTATVDQARIHSNLRSREGKSGRRWNYYGDCQNTAEQLLSDSYQTR